MAFVGDDTFDLAGDEILDLLGETEELGVDLSDFASSWSFYLFTSILRNNSFLLDYNLFSITSGNLDLLSILFFEGILTF